LSDLLKYILEQKEIGREFPQIKRELMDKGMQIDEADRLIRKADSIYLDKLLKGKPETSNTSGRIAGYGLIIIGVGVTLATYTGLINLGDSYILFYGPIVSGIALIAYQRRKGSGKSRLRSSFSVWKEGN
jgi:hypothetical protein